MTQPDTSDVIEVTTPQAIPCEAHKHHAPANLTVEFHHVVPVAWQLHTQAPKPPPFPGTDPNGRGMLWDARGEWLCPTGHRNVHRWIVLLMRAISAQDSDDVVAAYKAVRAGRRGPVELPIAATALTRYGPYGSLLALTQAGEWGQV